MQVDLEAVPCFLVVRDMDEVQRVSLEETCRWSQLSSAPLSWARSRRQSSLPGELRI